MHLIGTLCDRSHKVVHDCGAGLIVKMWNLLNDLNFYRMDGDSKCSRLLTDSQLELGMDFDWAILTFEYAVII